MRSDLTKGNSKKEYTFDEETGYSSLHRCNAFVLLQYSSLCRNGSKRGNRIETDIQFARTQDTNRNFAYINSYLIHERIIEILFSSNSLLKEKWRVFFRGFDECL